MLRVLAAEHNFETCEWLEPRADSRESEVSDGDPARQDKLPRAMAFARFLRDSLRTLSLCMESGAASDAGASLPPAAGGRRRLVILDDLAPAGQTSSMGGRDLREEQIVRAPRDSDVPARRSALCGAECGFLCAVPAVPHRTSSDVGTFPDGARAECGCEQHGASPGRAAPRV